MPICPECEGKGWYKTPIHDPHQGFVDWEIHTCPECIGKGKINRIRFVVYKARGESAPKEKGSFS